MGDEKNAVEVFLVAVDDDGSAILALVNFGVALQLDACGVVLAEVHQNL